MGEAGRLADLQEELRDMGIPFDAVLALYEGMDGGPPTDEEVAEVVDRATDASDPDRNFPVFAATESDLADVFGYDGGHPGHCVLDADRVIVWCVEGHSVEDASRQAVIDAWEAGR
jgi:hypothetical protein